MQAQISTQPAWSLDVSSRAKRKARARRDGGGRSWETHEKWLAQNDVKVAVRIAAGRMSTTKPASARDSRARVLLRSALPQRRHCLQPAPRRPQHPAAPLLLQPPWHPRRCQSQCTRSWRRRAGSCAEGDAAVGSAASPGDGGESAEAVEETRRGKKNTIKSPYCRRNWPRNDTE